MKTSCLLILFLFISCNLQKDILINKKKEKIVLECIDVKDFKKGSYIDEYSNRVQNIIVSDKKGNIILYIIHTKFKDSYIESRKVYHETGLINTEIKYLNGLMFGKSKEYDINGYFIKEENYDESYNFSVYDLKELICEEYDFNLMDKSNKVKVKIGYSISRTSLFDKQIYSILFYNISGKITKEISVDGNTGEIICENNIILERFPHWKEFFPKSKTPQKQYMDLKNSLKK